MSNGHAVEQPRTESPRRVETPKYEPPPTRTETPRNRSANTRGAAFRIAKALRAATAKDRAREANQRSINLRHRPSPRKKAAAKIKKGGADKGSAIFLPRDAANYSAAVNKVLFIAAGSPITTNRIFFIYLFADARTASGVTSRM